MVLGAAERILIKRAIKRDREAFGTIYVQYHDAVVSRVLAITRDRDEAEDIASEAFLRAWNAIDRFEERDVSILAWLCTIAERLAFKAARTRRPSINIDNVPVAASLEDSPEEIAERKSEFASVRHALIELSPVQQDVLSQRFLKHRSYDDVGESLGKSGATVRVIQHRALAALRKIIIEKARRDPASASLGGSR